MKGFKVAYIVCVILCIGISGLAQAQDADIGLQVEANQALENSQSINIQSLVANNGRGPTLFRMYLQNNNASEYANNLYFEILVRSNNIGLIAEATQINGQPFSLSPGQQVYATNNNIADGLPGVEEVIRFGGDVTPQGREFINNLKGATSLPPDRYSVEVNIYQGAGQQKKVASDIAEIGTRVIEDTRNFYLLSPGDAVGSEAVISNPYPNFQWQGVTGSSYRLLIVESKGNESPQSLLGGAESTEPTRKNGSPAGGSLIDYEMLDAVINQSSFQYPSSGVQDLEAGKTYYWRIINTLQTSSGEEIRRSEIWSFMLSGNQGSGSGFIGSPEVTNALQSILGEEFSKLSEQGLQFNGVEIDGQVYRGGQALQKLRELVRKSDQGDVTFVIEGQ